MRNRKGFTLIELMIVIAIIGILAAVAVPNFNRARIEAKAKACLAQCKTMQASMEQYDMDQEVGGATNAPALMNTFAGLISDGYMKEIPKCRSTGKASSYKWSGSATAAAISGSPAINLREVYCTHHGSPTSPAKIKSLAQ